MKEKEWLGLVQKELVGRKIVMVRFMTKEEAEENMWDQRPIVIQLDDGNIIYPSMDDEGNNGGALFTNSEELPVIPVMR